MLVGGGDEPHHEEAHDGEEQVHPIFVEDVDMTQGLSGLVLMFVVVFEQSEGQRDDENHHT